MEGWCATPLSPESINFASSPKNGISINLLGRQSKREELIRQRTDELLQDLHTSIGCLNTLENDVKSSHGLLKALREDFLGLQVRITKVSVEYPETTRQLLELEREMEVDAYIESVIRHLVAADPGLTAVTNYSDSTSGDKIWFTNPDDIGSDVDGLHNTANGR